MADRDILDRLDKHMARGNELMELVREEMALSRQDHADLRQFIREMTLRQERVAERQVKHMDLLSEEVQQQTATLRDFRVELGVELRDVREESRAQREALFRLIDELRGGR